MLLIKKLSAEDQKTYDIVKSGRFAGMEHEIQSNSEYYEQELSICLDNESPCPTLKPGLALLFVKKQIHDEASKCLYSKNTFGVALNDSDCHSPWASIHYLFDDNEFPTMSRKNFGHIENFIIMVQNTTSLDDPKLLTSTKNCEDALGAVIASIYYHGNKSLKMLRVRYSSCFEGMIELRREILEHSRTGPPEEAMLKDCNTGEIVTFKSQWLGQAIRTYSHLEHPHQTYRTRRRPNHPRRHPSQLHQRAHRSTIQRSSQCQDRATRAAVLRSPESAEGQSGRREEGQDEELASVLGGNSGKVPE